MGKFGTPVTLMVAGWALLAASSRGQDTNVTTAAAATSETAGTSLISEWLAMVAHTQAEQPHWAPPVGIVSPCLQQVLRYDITDEFLKGGRSLTLYGSGKGLEFIPAEQFQCIIGLPPWETENTKPDKNGWGDEMFLVKYRIAAANEEEGNYVVSAFMGMTVPNGSSTYSLDHYTFTPTLALGKGWGDFDLQSTINFTVPDNGFARGGGGTPLVANLVAQYHVARYFWPEVEANYTWWPDGIHEGLNQLFITPGIVFGRFPVAGRVALGLGLGCQIAVTDNALSHRNLILSGRIMF
jgi:hypothetical protein